MFFSRHLGKNKQTNKPETVSFVLFPFPSLPTTKKKKKKKKQEKKKRLGSRVQSPESSPSFRPCHMALTYLFNTPPLIMLFNLIVYQTRKASSTNCFSCPMHSMPLNRCVFLPCLDLKLVLLFYRRQALNAFGAEARCLLKLWFDGVHFIDLWSPKFGSNYHHLTQ